MQPAVGAHAARGSEVCRRLPDATGKDGAERSETQMPARKERQASRRDERDRHGRRRHSAERHRRERSRSRHRDSSRHHRASSGRHDRERPPFRNRSPVRRGSDRQYRAPSPYRPRNGVPDEAVRHVSGRPGQQPSDSLHRASPAARWEGDLAADEDTPRHGWIVPRVSVEPQLGAAAPQVHNPRRLPPHLERNSGYIPCGSFSTAHREPHTDRAPYSCGLSYRGVPIESRGRSPPQVRHAPYSLTPMLQ